MPPKYPPTIGVPKRVTLSRYDFITANLPAINITKLKYNKAITQEAFQETKGLLPGSSDFIDKLLPAIKVSKVASQKTINKQVQTGTGRSTSVPLKQFLNALLPAVGVSKEHDCFNAQLNLAARKKAPSFFNQCLELLHELEHEKLISNSLPNQDRSSSLKETYTESLASNFPHSILLRFDILSCVSKLLSTIIVLPPDKCELYLTHNFPVDGYPFSGLSGPEISFRIYSSLNDASNLRDKIYVLDLLAKILSIDSNSLIGPYVSDTLKSNVFLVSTFKTPKLADLYIRTYIQNDQLVKALRVFANAYLSNPFLLNLKLSEREILHALQQHQKGSLVAKKQRLGFPKFQLCLDLANMCSRQYSLAKNEIHLEISHLIYLAFIRNQLFSDEWCHSAVTDSVSLDTIKFLAFSPLQSSQVLDDLLNLLTSFNAYIDPETHIQILKKFTHCEKVSYSCKYTWTCLKSKGILADRLVKADELHQISLREDFARVVFGLFHRLNSQHRIKEAAALLLTAIENIFKEPVTFKASGNHLRSMTVVGFPSFETMWELWGNLIKSDDEPLSIHLFLFLEKAGTLNILPHKAEYLAPDGHHLRLEYQYLIRFNQMVNSSSPSRNILPDSVLATLDDSELRDSCEAIEPDGISLDSLISCLYQKIESSENLLVPC